MPRGLIRWARANRAAVGVVVVVLSAHAAGTVLSGLRFGPGFVLAVSSAVAASLWVVVRAGREGPLPARVRAALLAVWLVPTALLWTSVGVARVSAEFFPTRPPDNDGVIESVSECPFGGFTLHLRVAPVPVEGWPVPKNEQELQQRQRLGIVIVHVPPAARVQGQPPSGPQVGQRARTWCQDFVMTSDPPQQIAEYVVYAPAGE